jgi:hypothetical protein
MAISYERGTPVTPTSLTGADMRKVLLESDIRERMDVALPQLSHGVRVYLVILGRSKIRASSLLVSPQHVMTKEYLTANQP